MFGVTFVIALMLGLLALNSLPLLILLAALSSPLLFCVPGPIPILCYYFDRSCPPSFPVHGYVATGWESVRDQFEKNLAERRESGTQLAVYHRGRLVVDLVGGQSAQMNLNASDEELPVTALRHSDGVAVFSCSKVIESLVIAMAVDQGLYLYYIYIIHISSN